jgi:D-lactate dehydrogenase
MDTLTPQLSALMPLSRIKSRPIDRIAYANDASYFQLVPQAVVQPDSVSEIQALFRFSRESRIPLTFRAAGTSLSGQAVTDGILVDISKHWGGYSVENGGELLRAQPGIVGGFLNNVLKPYKRRIGPDPASIDACMLGGILANNSSGMCCGVTENSYQTIHSLTIVLPNGLVLDTADPNAANILHEGAPEIERGLMELRERLLSADNANFADETGKKKESLAERVRRRYKMKNTNGYQLQAFTDFDTPLDILTHLMIGSEGTLGFIAESVLHTLPDLARRYTGMLYFNSVVDAASAIAPLRDSGARAAEIMDRASLRSVENNAGVPAVLKELPEGAAAILVEYQAIDAESIQNFQREAEKVVKTFRMAHDPEFTDDPIRQAALWKPRKGIIASVGAMRPPGTTSVNEDVAFPFQYLAEAVADLRALFDDHGYNEGVIFGHAKDGNLHFLVNQAFDTPEQIRHFDGFIRKMVEIVSGKYDGALKAEHGTGRNMAAFVETEWGPQGYAIMRDLKSLFDPEGILSPGVMINDNPQSHVTHLKSLATVDPLVDKCIECGFCEPKCPSRRLTLTPRQRIVVQREMARLRELGTGNTENAELLASLSSSFDYDGLDTCAVDGLCATACPVGINTGDLTKKLRAGEAKDGKAAGWIADNFATVEKTLGLGVNAGHLAEKIIGRKSFQSIFTTAEKISGVTLPKWNNSVPGPIKQLPVARGEKDYVYFPSCISRQLGQPVDQQHSLAETLITVARRANLILAIPDNVEGTCCGMPFGSKGYTDAYKATLHRAILKFWAWSERGKVSIVIDTTSCAHSLRTCADYLDSTDLALYRQISILDSVEFIHDTLLPKLELHPVDVDVMLHPNCSARKLGIDSKLVAIAQKCARSASVPLNLGCCAFAGDRGLLFPELTASATALEAAEVNEKEYSGGYYSSNITCEMGMREATGRDYLGIVYLVEKASRPGNSSK